MTKIKTADLTGPALDWAVAKCEGRTLKRNPMGKQVSHGWWIWEETPSGKGGILLDKSIYMELGPRIHPKTRISSEKYSPSTDWSQGGPIIEREWICVDRLFNGQWCAAKRTLNDDDAMRHRTNGPTPLIAAMRCFVASRLGDEVDVPDELTGD